MNFEIFLVVYNKKKIEMFLLNMPFISLVKFFVFVLILV